jgi:hypothetical protein
LIPDGSFGFFSLSSSFEERAGVRSRSFSFSGYPENGNLAGSAWVENGLKT